MMDELWQKRDKSKKSKSKSIENDFIQSMPVIKAAQLKPDWNRIPSKNIAMSEEEFEEAIRTLALADAERGMKMGNAGKGILAGEMDRSKLLTKYISVVSPDRKAAYENFNGKGDVIYGSFNQKLMTRDNNGVWNSENLTKEEMARVSKFNEIYTNTLREYEAEHGPIPYTNSSKSGSDNNPYKLLAAYNPSAYSGYYSMYNVLA
ncbi:MAG: hypothetical protein FWH22_09460 [Fibromonadales bacterium]|nr:hypothetical protein [Fibromonadales bacterium]